MSPVDLRFFEFVVVVGVAVVRVIWRALRGRCRREQTTAQVTWARQHVDASVTWIYHTIRPSCLLRIPSR